MDVAQRIQIASSFLSQSPPGEINDVLNGMTINYLVDHVSQLLKMFEISSRMMISFKTAFSQL